MITLHFAGYQPARSVHTRALHALRASVARRVRRNLSVSVTDSVVAAGHKAADLLEMVQRGELDGCYFASSYLAAGVPALSVLDLPFDAGSREEVFARLAGETGALLSGAVAAAGEYCVLAWWDNGIRHISNAVRPIRTPADCVGLRLRTLDNARHQVAFRRLGFHPVFIDVADLPQAVADRTVDAQENPLTNMVNFGLHRSHRHVSLTGHLIGVAPLLINRRRYDALPGELRQALAAAAEEASVVQRRLAIAEDATCLRVLGEAGVAVLGPEAIDLRGFHTATGGHLSD